MGVMQVNGLRVSPRLLLAVLGCLCLAGGALAGPVAYIDPFGTITVLNHPRAVDPVSALSLLPYPPPGPQAAWGVTSALPPGTNLLDFRVEDNRAIVNFSRRLVARGAGETTLAAVFDQVTWTLRCYGINADVVILVEGVPFADYALPTPPIEPRVGVTSLSGYSITLSPGHGRVWNGSAWGYQRSPTCGGTLSREDDHNLEMAQYLEIYLANDGMTVKVPRCTDKNYGNHPSGAPWWQMCSVYWLYNLGYPCSVWGSTTDCTPGSGANEWNDDIRARPLASDYDNTSIYISLHTNALSGDCYGGSCPTGSDMYYDCSAEHASWCTVSTNLANAVNAAVINTIQTKIPLASWANRGVHDSAGAYGEIRIPDRAAILLELGFHDSCDLDVQQLKDNFFRSAAMWGIYKGVCDYFSQTPTWDFYSDELVSHDIPATMSPGQQTTVHLTFRNKGVLWTETRQIRLGAVGDSDPFTGATRHYITGEVGPNGTYQFSFTLTAPTTPGVYLTDWRMLRESVTWFGATCSQNVNVCQIPDTEPPTVPTNLTATPVSPTQINLSWTASTDNVGVAGYKVFRGGGQIGTSTTTTYSDNTCQPNTTYTYNVSAYDGSGNESAQSAPAQATTPVQSEYIIDEESCTYLGTWTTSTTTGGLAYNNDYRYVGTATSETAWAKWTPNILTSGQYDTYVYYRSGANRSTKAPYTVVYKGGQTTFQVNQTINGGQWNLITNKPFDAGTAGNVKLGNGTAEASKVVIADAVRWYYTGPIVPPSEYIIDEEACTYLGTWTTSTSDPSQSYNGDYRYAGTATTETKWAKWTPNIWSAANFNVYCMYRSGSNRSVKAPYTVYWNGSSQTIEVNQTINGGTWVTLVTNKPFAGGTSGYVKLGNGTAEASKVVIADACRWLKQ
jgi:N-acetylmuramoyl-L-alanine amidase